MGPDRRKAGELRGKIKWLMLARLFVVTLLLGLSFLLHQNHLRNSDLLLSSAYFLIVIYAVCFSHVKNLFLFASAQLVIDLFLETALVGVTGGVESPFTFLYMISIVSWAIFNYRPGAILSASLSALLYGSLVGLQFSGLLFFLTPLPLRTGEFFFAFSINLLGFFSVGLLSGLLAEKLTEKEAGFAALRIFHEDIVKSITSGLLTTDLEGRITSFNRAATEISGFTLDEAMGQVWWEIIQWDEFRDRFKLLCSGGLPQRFDGETKNRWGERLLLGVTLSPLKDGSGRQTGVIGIFQDLTHYKRMEEEMARREKLATLGEMAASIAHEIRNPLGALSGSIQVLREEVGRLDPANDRLLEIALSEAERLNSIITQFLLYARPKPPQRRWCELSSLLKETLDLAKNDVECRGRVQVDLAGLSTVRLWVDPDQIKQVFWNLITNAFQSMPDGGTLSVAVSHVGRSRRRVDDRRGDCVEIRFEDTGEGIPEELLGKVFSPFFTTKSQGTGLGLAIVQRIVEAHGGRIQVESKVRGTVFTIFFPQLEVEASAADPARLKRAI